MFAFLHSYYFEESNPVEFDAVVKAFGSDRMFDEVSKIPSGSVVLPRYRLLPFGDLLEQEVESNGSRLISSWSQHLAVDDIFTWSNLLGDLTAPSYRIEDFSDVPEGRFFVKGQVNSRKNRGPTSVFADSKEQAIDLALSLAVDPILGNQEAVIRPVQDYLQLGFSETGLPVFHEQRVFVYKKQVLGTGFYWGKRPNVDKPPRLDERFTQALNQAVSRVGHISDYLVIDMAEYSDGHWGVVELNDAAHAGFNETIDPYCMYGNLAKMFKFN